MVTFREFVEAIVAVDSGDAIEMLSASPQLAKERASVGASRQDPEPHFFERIAHYMYEGDTALHMAAAAHQPVIAKALIAAGADVRATNRRGAQPLHYAVDGGPGSAAWNPEKQAKIVAILIKAGANPNAADKSGVGPLHRAVRNRCAAAVQALLEGGADPKAANGNGSTPLQLAQHNTGRSGSGSAEAKAQQQIILRLLESPGAV